MFKLLWFYTSLLWGLTFVNRSKCAKKEMEINLSDKF